MFNLKPIWSLKRLLLLYFTLNQPYLNTSLLTKLKDGRSSSFFFFIICTSFHFKSNQCEPIMKLGIRNFCLDIKYFACAWSPDFPLKEKLDAELFFTPYFEESSPFSNRIHQHVVNLKCLTSTFVTFWPIFCKCRKPYLFDHGNHNWLEKKHPGMFRFE